MNWIGVLSWTTFSYLKDPAYSQSWTFGYNTNSTNINKGDGSNSPYYIAFSTGGSSNTNQVVDSYTLSNIKTLNTNGKYIELSNGSSPGNMYASAFSIVSTPYYFKTSNSIGSYYGLSKTSDVTVENLGRAGVVTADGIQYYYMLNKIQVDGKPIEFTDAERELKLENVNKLNKYLVTKPFVINSNSDFTYNFRNVFIGQRL